MVSYAEVIHFDEKPEFLMCDRGSRFKAWDGRITNKCQTELGNQLLCHCFLILQAADEVPNFFQYFRFVRNKKVVGRARQSNDA
jgi:hypothetical protein